MLAFAVVLTLLIGYIAALILRARMQASLGTANAVRRTAEDMSVQSAANAVAAAWALAGASCASNPGLGVSCAGFGCSCVCTLASGATVTASPSAVGTSCQLTLLP
ncbi:MAG: hypothetical protein ACHQ51_09285 [Elusimicrobiota bacterium]